MDYTAVVYAEAEFGTKNYKTEGFEIAQNSCKKSESKFSLGYRGFFAEEAKDRLAKMGKNENYGQLMFHDQYAMGEVFIFEDLSRNATQWRVFIIENDTLKEFTIDKYDEFDSLTSYGISDTALYLHIYTNDNRIVLATVDLSNGAVVKEDIFLSDIGMKINQLEGVNWFDLRNNSMIFALSRGNENLIARYSFSDKSYVETKALGRVFNVFATDGGYMVIYKAVANQVGLCSYDMDFNLLEKKYVSLGLEKKKRSEKLKPLRTGYLQNNKYYGAVVESKHMYYYVIDLATGEVETLIKLQPGKGIMAKDFKIYEADGKTQPMPNLY